MKSLTLIAVLFLYFTTQGDLTAQVTGRKSWTPEFSFSLGRVLETSISPNAKYVAYVVRKSVMSDDKSEYESQIYVAAVDGSFNRQFTFTGKSNYSPRFSSDGSRLAFLSSRNGVTQVYIMSVDGGEAWQLTCAQTSVSDFKWSPDDTRIAYLMSDPETEEERQNKTAGTDIEIAGQDLKYRHIYVTEVPQVEQNRTTALQITAGAFCVNDFDWSPDGKRIVFSHQPDPEINNIYINSDISIVPSDSGKITRLVDWPGVDRMPLFSPNGKQIAFVSQGGEAEPIGLQDIYTIPLKGGKPVRLSLTPDRNASLLSWAPDGKSLYFSEVIGTSLHLFAISVKGEEMAIVTLKNRPWTPETEAGTPDDSHGTWGKFSMARDRRAFSYTWQSTEKPEEVFYSELMFYNPRQLSSLYSGVELPAIAPTSLIRWKSSDGYEIEGLLTYPAGYTKGKKYPLILLIHGGPAGAFIQYFTGTPTIYLLQNLASSGYAVLRANPRGSTGYGKDFRFANFKDWGYGDYDDLMSGVDKVIDMGIADKDQLYVAGWSYGGYLTSYIVTRTNRFRAASMGAGLPDLVSMSTTTDIPDYLAAHMGGELWNNYDTYIKHSAIYRLKDINTPVQIMHGEADKRVPVLQGKELYVALRRKGIPTELVLYPRSGHIPSEPRLMMDITPRMTSWFKKFSTDVMHDK